MTKQNETVSSSTTSNTIIGEHTNQIGAG